MATKYIVNNVTGQTINGQQILPYKVYTALLTQSGDGNPESIINSPLVIGKTYQIDNDGVPSGTWDFTNVGAPNNDIGTYFVANGTTPNNWGTNIVLGYTNGSPVVTVLENTIGNVWFSYVANGLYSVYSNGLFTQGKTALFIGSSFDGDTVGVNFAFFRQIDGDELGIATKDNALADGDGFLYNTPIEIRVYN
jgi:hypothetical protein